MFGLEQKDYDFIKKELQRALPNEAQVFCYGSRARGDHHKFSDLDIMIEGDEDYSRPIIKLKEVFEESNLPIKVDLVQFSAFAEAYKESYFRDKEAFFS